MKQQANGLYVGCALTDAPADFKAGVIDLKASLANRGYHVLEFVGEGPATNKKVYETDIACVSQAAAMLAIADYASIGLGWETATASSFLAKPTLAVAQTNRRVTRFLLGAAEVVENLEFQRYEELEEVPDQFEEFLDRHFVSFEAIQAALYRQAS